MMKALPHVFNGEPSELFSAEGESNLFRAEMLRRNFQPIFNFLKSKSLRSLDFHQVKIKAFAIELRAFIFPDGSSSENYSL